MTRMASPHSRMVDLERSIGQQHFLRLTTVVFHLQQVEVAKDAIDHKWDGQHHHVIGGQVGG